MVGCTVLGIVSGRLTSNCGFRAGKDRRTDLGRRVESSGPVTSASLVQGLGFTV